MITQGTPGNKPDKILDIEHALGSFLNRELTGDESASLFDYLSDETTGEFLTPLNDLRYLKEVMGF